MWLVEKSSVGRFDETFFFYCMMTNSFQVFTSLIFLVTACQSSKFDEEIQLTRDTSYNHDLDNNDNFSPDDQWLVYDTRTESGGIGGCSRIEKVHVQTGKKMVLYELAQNKSYGPGVGAVSYSHTENQVVFIHGLMNITEENPYQQWRRTGVIVVDKNAGIPIFMDSRDIIHPFTPGALRGGTHRHEWSGDGNWIGYTYNDAIMKQLEGATGQIHNLRTIGVSKNIEPVKVHEVPSGENLSGRWFSVLVVEVVPNPTPGSDQISRAAGDSWVGAAGYRNEKGAQQMARGFIGTVRDTVGKEVDEVFVVDIPDDITIRGESGPLEGTLTTLPAPPKGAIQRRLTRTARSKYPGCVGIVRSSPDGNMLAYQAYDMRGIRQIFTISPMGGNATQQTFHASDVQSGVRWHPDGTRFCYVWNNSLVIGKIGNSSFTVLTEKSSIAPSNPVISHDGKMIAYNRMIMDAYGNQTKQIFLISIN
jgi:hypothetical protein